MPDDRPELERKAVALARKAHQAQLDPDGSLHIDHVLRVAATLEGDARICALLHDVVEDSEWTVEQLRALGFPESVVLAVDALSKRDDEPYESYIERVLASGALAVRVKLADVEDNLRRSRLAGWVDFILRYERAEARLKTHFQTPYSGS